MTRPLPEELVVRVTDAEGIPQAGMTVSWSVEEGEATLSSPVTPTDEFGLASVGVTLGSTGGEVGVAASVEPRIVLFTATALVPEVILPISGDGQNGKTRTLFPEPFVARVLAGGMPVPGAAVDWSSGGATLDRTSTVTDANGLTSVTATAGHNLSTVGIRADVRGVDGVATGFSAHVTVAVIDLFNLKFDAPNRTSELLVSAGDTVEFYHRDTFAEVHTATSSSAPPGGSPIDSGEMTMGDRFRFVPDAVGTWDYFCEIHGAAVMSGTLTAG